jgi:hypothetical protein
METERMALSQQERDRLRVLQDVQQGHLTQVAAAQADQDNRPSGAPVIGALAGARRPGGDSWITRAKAHSIPIAPRPPQTPVATDEQTTSASP